MVEVGTYPLSKVAVGPPPVGAVGAGREGWGEVVALIELILFSEEGKIIPRISPAAIATKEGVVASNGGDGRWGTVKGEGEEEEAWGKGTRMAGLAARIAAPSSRTWSPTSKEMSVKAAWAAEASFTKWTQTE